MEIGYHSMLCRRWAASMRTSTLCGASGSSTQPSSRPRLRTQTWCAACPALVRPSCVCQQPPILSRHGTHGACQEKDLGLLKGGVRHVPASRYSLAFE